MRNARLRRLRKAPREAPAPADPRRPRLDVDGRPLFRRHRLGHRGARRQVRSRGEWDDLQISAGPSGRTKPWSNDEPVNFAAFVDAAESCGDADERAAARALKHDPRYVASMPGAQISAEAQSIASRSASPVSPPPSTAERGVPIAYVGGPLNGFVADHLGAAVQPWHAAGHYDLDDEALVMRWVPSKEVAP